MTITVGWWITPIIILNFLFLLAYVREDNPSILIGAFNINIAMFLVRVLP